MSEDGRRSPEVPEPDRGTPDVAWSITSSLLAGMLVWGGVGWLVDRWLGFDRLFLAIGVVGGLAAGLYLSVVKINRSS
jgi:ATP synthase protein I